MKTIETYFDKIFCINLDRRTDRWEECKQEMLIHNLTKIERFSGLHGFTIEWNGEIVQDGNAGCTESHGAILKKLVESNWDRILILEDDFRILHEDFHKQFNYMIGLVPEDWDMLYLGGHYACPPIKRINKHVIKHGGMLTTSSYGITRKFAEKIYKDIKGHGPIDALYMNYHKDYNCYIFQPRLMVQRPSFSDLQGREMNNEACMMDKNHENMV